jgi:putative aldouronate transport system permease protein
MQYALGRKGKLTPKSSLGKRIAAQKYLLLMAIPFMLWLILFRYVPIWGWIISFFNYKFNVSILHQQWVGLKYYIQLLSDQRFWLDFRNTLGMSVLGLASGFMFPIAFALLLNEVRQRGFKRGIQTVSYLPHFLSWVVVTGIFMKILSTDGGAVNDLLVAMGILKEPVQFMAQPKLFWWMITAVSVWKELGWSSIIYLAAIAGIDQELYQAAVVDGCNRMQKMLHVTLPGISSTIIILFIMDFGHLTQIGFERQMLMGNSIVVDYSEVIDLYALKYGIGMGR